MYSLSKIAGEELVCGSPPDRAASPLTIIRIFSTYGPEGGRRWPACAGSSTARTSSCTPMLRTTTTPIFEDDYVRLAIRALEVATAEPVVVNFAGSETVSAEDYCAYLGELVNRPVRIRYDDAPWPLWPDVTRMHAVLGRTEVPWREGMRRIAETVG